MIPPFEYHAPSTLPQALDLLTRHGEEAHAIAGGTSLVLLMRQGLVRPGHVVALRGIADLRGIGVEADGALVINACATHRDAERSPLVRSHSPALADTFGHVATVRIRNQGTVGGNLAHADPAQDPPPMLLALDAEVRLVAKSGARTIPLSEFFTDVFETALAPGEILRSIRVPRTPKGARGTYVKFLPRTEDDYATVSVAAVIATDATGVCTHARIAIGAAGPIPFRAHAAEAALAGKLLDPLAFEAAAELAADAADPIADLRGSSAYKKDMVRVWTRRALQSLAGATG